MSHVDALDGNDHVGTRKLGHTAARNSYLSSVASMLARYPNLTFLHEALTTGPNREVGRAAVLEVRHQTVVRRVDFHSSGQLSQYLEQASETSSNKDACTRRIYLVEGLPTAYVELLGAHLHIDPSIFARQLLTRDWEVGRIKGNTPVLPSRREPSCHSFALRYNELRAFDGVFDHNLRCTNQDRMINATRLKGRFDGVGLVRRKATFWTRWTEGGGWNVLLLTDPPIGELFAHAYIAGCSPIRLSNTLFHGGYVDFSDVGSSDEPISNEAVTLNALSPSRTSLFDDMCFYLQHRSCDSGVDLDDPGASAVLVNRIVASNWMILIQYIKSIVSQLELTLSQRKNFIELEAEFDWLDEGWSDLQTWVRRCSEYCEHIEQTLSELGVTSASSRTRGCACPTPSPSTNDRDEIACCHIYQVKDDEGVEDFLYIHARLQDLKVRSERLSGSLTGLITISESKRSYQEAQSVKTLAFLGMLFVPLAFTSSLFSMGGSYMPGESRFWVFFAVSMPLILLVFAMVLGARYWPAFILRLGKTFQERRLAFPLGFRIRRKRRESLDKEY